MASRKIIEVSCSRCGTTTYISDERELNFGIGNTKDWTVLSIRHHLCPQCSIPFKRFMTEFFDKGQCYESWRFRKGEEC